MKTPALFLLSALACCAQVVLPEGTKVRVRLDQSISSATAEEGQVVELSVTDAVKIGDVIVIAEGARATGTVTQAHEKRRMGRAGKLDFSIDRVKTVDNDWVSLRYTVTKKSGESHAVSTGVLTAGVAVVFWPAAPVMLLRKGQDITINRGMAFDVYTDANKTIGGPAATAPVTAASAASAPTLAFPPANSATLSITSSIAAADIEIDGAFVGNTPTTVQLASGQHRIVVKNGAKSWQRTLHVSSGSTVTLNATPQ
jgi:hypothetical protein